MRVRREAAYGGRVSARWVSGCANVPRAGAFGRLFLFEAHALAFFEILEAATLHRAAVEKPLLATLVANEPEPLFPRQTLDRAARHDVSLSAGPNDPFGLYTVSRPPRGGSPLAEFLRRRGRRAAPKRAPILTTPPTYTN